MLPGHPTLRATKSGTQQLTLAGLSDVLAGHIGGGQTRPRGGQGGYIAREAAPERPGAVRWRCGHFDHTPGWCEVARIVLNGRVRGYVSDPATLVLLSPYCGLSVYMLLCLGKRIMTSVFNICRLGDAVVSTPRKTRPHVNDRIRQ